MNRPLLPMRFFAVSDSSFAGLPLCKILFRHLASNDQIDRIDVYHASSPSDICELNIEKLEVHRLNRAVDPSRHSFEQKLTKWVRLFWELVKIAVSRRRHVLYSNSIRTVALASVLKAFAGSPMRLCFHQFEAIEFENCGAFDQMCKAVLSRFSNCVDLVLMPESNRLRYFESHFPNLSDRLRLCLNTSNSRSISDLHEAKRREQCAKRLSVMHVGNLGLDTYWQEILTISQVPEMRVVTFDFVGFVHPIIMEHAKGLDNVHFHGRVPHTELVKYYLIADIGLILYKPTTLNSRFAAPNKMYEFWSFGVPVIGPNLPGLVSQFTSPKLGTLIDFAKEAESVDKFVRVVQTHVRTAAQEVAQFFEAELCAEKRIPRLADEILGILSANGTFRARELTNSP